jgi:hypothetical protein
LLTRLVTPEPDEPPHELSDAKRLSPWAVATRYDEIDAALDRELAVRIGQACLNWAAERVDEARADRPVREPPSNEE